MLLEDCIINCKTNRGKMDVVKRESKRLKERGKDSTMVDPLNVSAMAIGAIKSIVATERRIVEDVKSDVTPFCGPTYQRKRPRWLSSGSLVLPVSSNDQWLTALHTPKPTQLPLSNYSPTPTSTDHVDSFKPNDGLISNRPHPRRCKVIKDRIIKAKESKRERKERRGKEATPHNPRVIVDQLNGRPAQNLSTCTNIKLEEVGDKMTANENKMIGRRRKGYRQGSK
eukprot:Ihof_evm8s247 gene=Ihof_evmTU8s247